MITSLLVVSYTSPFSTEGCERTSLCKLGLTSQENSQELPRLERPSRQWQVRAWMPWCAEKPPWQHPRAQQQLHLSESLWERDNWRQDQAGRGGASERGSGHILLPPELDFRALKCQRLWGTIQDTPWHCTHSKVRDSEPQDCNVPI